MSLKYKIVEVKPRIFFLDFKRQYDMCMMFLRYQEYYESSSSKFRDKSFTIIDFMEWYSYKYANGIFSYTKDWSGFNISANIISNVLTKHGPIKDYNKYDVEMGKVYAKCIKKYPDEKFYIIGAVGVEGAMKHEIAHGTFFINPEYKKKMTKLVENLKPAFRNRMFEDFKKIGYAKKVYIDECQAYLATGLTYAFKGEFKRERKAFIEVYEEYYNN